MKRRRKRKQRRTCRVKPLFTIIKDWISSIVITAQLPSGANLLRRDTRRSKCDGRKRGTAAAVALLRPFVVCHTRLLVHLPSAVYLPLEEVHQRV